MNENGCLLAMLVGLILFFAVSMVETSVDRSSVEVDVVVVSKVEDRSPKVIVQHKDVKYVANCTRSEYKLLKEGDVVQIVLARSLITNSRRPITVRLN